MGLLDDAIREHLDLKRRRGADPAEVERAEREALGPVRRAPQEPAAPPFGGEPGDEGSFAYDHEEDELWEDEHGEAWAEFPEHELEPGPSSGEAVQRPPRFSRPYEAPSAGDPFDTEHEHSQGPTPLEDEQESSTAATPLDADHDEFIDEGAEDEDRLGSSTTPPPAAATPPPRRALDEETEEYEVELGDESEERPSGPESGAVGEPPRGEHPPRPPSNSEPPSQREGQEAEPASDPKSKEGDDVLEGTPDFLQDTPEHDRLWFEQKPPRDFDFGN